MRYYDNCREAEKKAKEAYSYYEAELSQLSSAVGLIYYKDLP